MSERSAIYARYSSRNQDDGTSIEVQLQQCKAVAGANARQYIDRAVSGTIMDRPALGRLIADAESGEIDAIYVYKYDRFGRSAYAHAVVADLEAMGTKVISVTEGHDPLARGIQLVVAEDVSRKLSERVRLGRAQRFGEGKHLGGVPAFGYRVQDGKLVIVPNEADAIRQAYQWYASGNYSYRDISQKLRDMGFKPRRVEYWSPGMMKAFFRLPLYRGIRRYRGQKVYEERLRIVSDEMHDRVQRRNTARREIRRESRGISVFTGLLVCGCCGHPYMRRVDRYRGKLYPAKWVCGRRQQDGAHQCPSSPWLMESRLLEDLYGCLDRVIGDVDQFADEAVKEASAMQRPNQTQIEKRHREIKKLDQETERLISMVTSGRIADPDAAAVLGSRIGTLKRQQDALREEVAAMEAQGRTYSDATVRRMVLKILREGYERLVGATTPAEINAFFRDELGQMQVKQGGTVASLCQSVCPPGRTSHPQGGILRAAFWSRWVA